MIDFSKPFMTLGISIMYRVHLVSYLPRVLSQTHTRPDDRTSSRIACRHATAGCQPCLTAGREPVSLLICRVSLLVSKSFCSVCSFAPCRLPYLSLCVFTALSSSSCFTLYCFSSCSLNFFFFYTVQSFSLLLCSPFPPSVVAAPHSAGTRWCVL